MINEFQVMQAAKYGGWIVSELSGKTINANKEMAAKPGGLLYEANRIGIGPWELIEAIEGMCIDGRAEEVEKLVYRIKHQRFE